MLKITDWHERYEVSFRGGEPKEGDALRVGPLRFVRLKVHGYQQGTGYRRLLLIAKDKSMQVFGIFCKFLEISGNQPRDLRGGLYNEKGKPASLQDLAFILSVPMKQIAHAVGVLSGNNIGWLYTTEQNPTELNSTQHNSTQGAGDLCKFPEIPKIPEKQPEEKDAYGEFVKLTKPEYMKLEKRFGSQLQDKIDALNEGIGSKGYKYKSHYFTILAWERRHEREGTSKSQRAPAPQASSGQTGSAGGTVKEFIR